MPKGSGTSGEISSGLWRGDSSQFSKPLLRELAVLRLLEVLSPMEFRRKYRSLSAFIAQRSAASLRNKG